ncbi:MAG TPA: MFS transporter, partial [Sphingomonadaceae bacterium]|nr:MFS transporter [Sphingomonadaceae bacterium]
MIRLRTYENGLLLMLSMTNAVVLFDRFSVNYLAPFIVEEFKLSNAQFGMLSSAVSLAVAPAGLILARVAEKSGQRKRMLIVCLIAFSLLSASAAFATSFLFLLVVRFLLGVPDAPIPPVAQSVIAVESSEHRRGLNMAIMQKFSSAIIGIGVGAIVFTQIAEAFGWRAAMLFSCVPGLALALCVALFMRPVREGAKITSAIADHERVGTTGILSLLRSRNVLLCVLICGLYSAWIFVLNAFMPLYLVRVRGMDAGSMGMIVSATGFAQAIAGIAIAATSDRIGRKMCMALMLFLSAAAPLSVLFVHGSPVVLGLCLFVAFMGAGATPLISVVAAESVSEKFVASVIALCIAAGE